MNLRDLTLDEIYDLELKSTPLAGNRSAVFLSNSERVGKGHNGSLKPAKERKIGRVQVSVGDSVRVHTNVIGGANARAEIFVGIVVGHRGQGSNATFTVRQIRFGEDVERIFPVQSRRIAKIEVVKADRRAKVSRAKVAPVRVRKSSHIRKKDGFDVIVEGPIS